MLGSWSLNSSQVRRPTKWTRSTSLRRSYVRSLFAVAVILSLQSCALSADVYNTSFEGVTWDNTNWVLTTTRPDSGHYQSRANLANGYIGINVASVGPFFDLDVPVDGDNINGWPLFDRRQSFATVAGFYDVQPATNGTNYPWLNQLGGESVISGLPHWSGLSIEVNGDVLDASTNLSQISGFSSALDMKRGLISWTYTWTPSTSCPLNVSYSLILHKLSVNHAATQLNITSPEDVSVNVTDMMQGDCAVRSFLLDKQFVNKTNTIWSAVQPDNIPYVTAYVYSILATDNTALPGSRVRRDDPVYIGSNSSGIAQQITLNVQKKSAVYRSKVYWHCIFGCVR